MKDIDKVVKLLRIVFGPEKGLDKWVWKHLCNPVGCWVEDGDIWVVENKNEIIGYRATLPLKLKFGNEKIIAAQTIDVVVHPKCREKGISKALSEKFYLDAKKRYVVFFAFPVKRIREVRLRLGWKAIPTTIFVKVLNFNILNNFSLNKLLISIGKLSFNVFNFLERWILNKLCEGFSIEIVKVEKFPAEIDRFWNFVRNEYEVVLERTSSFLNWRFSKNFGKYDIYLAYKTHNKTIVGYVVFKKEAYKGLRMLSILDLQVLPNEYQCFLRLLEVVLTTGKNEQFDLVYCWFPGWWRYSKFLLMYGFIPINNLTHLFGLGKPCMVAWSYDLERILKVKKWFYSLADADFA